LTSEYDPPDVGAGVNKTVYEYDLDKSLTHITRPDGEKLDFAYDSAGRLNKLTTPQGDTTYGYDATTGKLTGINAPDGGTLAYVYTGALRTGSTWSGAVNGSVGLDYNNDWRIASVNVNGANPVTYQYDSDGLRKQVGDLILSPDAQNGLLTGTTLGQVKDSLTYNGFGERVDYLTKYGDSELLKDRYDRDKLGRITEKQETINGVKDIYNYGYDQAGRLTEIKKNNVVQATYGYDLNGNRTHLNSNEIAHYDDQDRLLDYNGIQYGYTANGELKTRTVGNVTTTYVYDVLGNLREVTFPNTTKIEYVIDGQNRRVGKKINGTLVQAFLYQDQLKPVAELDGSGNIVSRFVYATRVNVPDYMIKGGVTYRIITDHLGSPRLVVDVATNTASQRMDYDAWGNVINDSNPGFQPFGFAGGLYDRDTGLVRFGARDYDAETARWVMQDPILFAGEENNLYGYAFNDPINFIDPRGRKIDWLMFFSMFRLINSLVHFGIPEAPPGSPPYSPPPNSPPGCVGPPPPPKPRPPWELPEEEPLLPPPAEFMFFIDLVNIRDIAERSRCPSCSGA
jgi:RHS repeat-associated protein